MSSPQIIAWLCSTRLDMMSSRRFWTDLFGLAAALPPLRRFRSHRHPLRCTRADLVSFAELRVLNSCVLALVASAGYRQVFAYLANKAANTALYVSLLDPSGIKTSTSLRVRTTRSTAVWHVPVCWTLPGVSAQCVVSSSVECAPSGQEEMSDSKQAINVSPVLERMCFMKCSSSRPCR